MRLWSVYKDGTKLIGWVLGDHNAATVQRVIGDTFEVKPTTHPIPKRWASKWIPIWKDSAQFGSAQWGAFVAGWNTWIAWQLQHELGYTAAKTSDGAFAHVGAPPAPPGYAPIFPEWNVWQIWQADDPTFDLMTVGLSLDRQLRIFVENTIADGAPGAAVSDPANPFALRGEQAQIIPAVTGLEVARTRAEVPEFAGATQLGKADSTAKLRTVRFWNRGAATVVPWPHDSDHLLDTVFVPSASNPVTSAEQPGSLAGAVSSAADTAGTTLKIVGIGAAALLLVVLLTRRGS